MQKDLKFSVYSGSFSVSSEGHVFVQDHQDGCITYYHCIHPHCEQLRITKKLPELGTVFYWHGNREEWALKCAMDQGQEIPTTEDD